jgi:uncharacterized protein YaeQ
MAAGSTLFRINVDLSNIDAGQYQSFELRLAQHPSEDLPRLVTRALAYCLAYEEALQWGPGLEEPDEPALFARDSGANLKHWIDVGTPSAERMHKASKAAAQLTIVCHKSTEALIRERERRAIHRADRLRIWLLEPAFVTAVAERLQRGSEWVVVKTGDELMLTVNETTLTGSITETTLSAL